MEQYLLAMVRIRNLMPQLPRNSSPLFMKDGKKQQQAHCVHKIG